MAIKKKQDKNKVSKEKTELKCKFYTKFDILTFSFKYVTNQEKYSLKRFSKSSDFRSEIKLLDSLYVRLQIMSNEGWEGLRKRNKYQGGREILEYSQLSFNAHDPNNELNLTNDSKIISIRFGGDKYRLLGYKSDLCPTVFHIIGLDLDFSAYNHGS